MNRRCSWRRCLGLLAAVLPLILISCGPRVTISAPTPVVLGSSATVGTSAPDATIDSALTALTVPTERPSTTAPPTLTNTPVSPIGSTAQSTSTIVQLQTTAEIAATEPTPIPTEIQVSNSGGGTNNIAVGGPTLRLQTRPGQTAEVKFAGRSGQLVSLGIHQTEPDWLRVTLVGPNRKNVMEGDVVGDRTLTA